MSSDSEPFEVSDLRRSSRSRKHASGAAPKKRISSKVENLTEKLQDANRNLKSVDNMLTEYKDLEASQSGVMDRLRSDLVKSAEELEEERFKRSLRDSVRSMRPSDLDMPRERRHQRRVPTSPLRDYDKAASDREYTDRRGRARGGVRFFDDMDTGRHLHGIHQSLRDLTSEQLRMGEDLNREINNRQRLERDSKSTFRDLRSTFGGQAASAADSRLQNLQDELRAERQSLRKREDEVGKISTDLKQAIEGQRTTHTGVTLGDMDAQSRAIQAEAQKSQVECELERVRRRLDQAEGGRNALLDQIETLRDQVKQSESEKYRYQNLLEQYEDDLRVQKNRMSADEVDRERWDRERRHMEDEMKDLRSQLTRSAVAVGDYGETRRELEQSEKQRAQLSDHIQVLNKENEDREKQAAKALNQLQEMSDKFHESERQRQQGVTQFEELMRKFREATRTSESTAAELSDTQQRFQESEKKKEEIKMRAQETVRQWKLKCKKLERDADRESHSARQATERNEHLIKELESVKNQGSHSVHQTEQMKRELGEVLAVRAQQDEHIRMRDIETNELKTIKMDLEKDLRDCKVVIERLEAELRQAGEKAIMYFDEKSKFEDQCGHLHNSNLMLQTQIQGLQKELHDTSREKVELSAQMANMAEERKDLRASLADARKEEAVARDEVDSLMKRLKEEKEFFGTKTEALRSELEQYKMRETHMVQDLTRRYKKEQAELEAEVQGHKLSLQEEKSSSKLLRKQHDKLQQEVERLHTELVKSQGLTEVTQKKYQKVKEKFLSKAQVTETGLSRAKEVELELLDSKELLRRLENDYQNILRSVAGEIDSLVEVAAMDAHDTCKAQALTSIQFRADDSYRLLAEVKSKLEWVKNEIREFRQKELQLRKDMRDTVENNDKHREFYISELTQQNNKHNEKHSLNSDVPVRDVNPQEPNHKRESNHHNEHVESTVPSKEELAALGDNLLHNQEDLLRSADRLNHETQILISQNNSLSVEPHGEREKINERYAKLQETMNVLKQELFDTRRISSLFQGSPSGKSNNHRHVTICDQPTIHSPVANSTALETTFDTTLDLTDPAANAKTPPPLTLSDEEFMRRFLPNSP